jgi:hypothetical protein
MQESIVLKECIRCHKTTIGNHNEIHLSPGDVVKFIHIKQYGCKLCPSEIGPRPFNENNRY